MTDTTRTQRALLSVIEHELAEGRPRNAHALRAVLNSPDSVERLTRIFDEDKAERRNRQPRHPSQNLLALAMGMWAWQGKAMKTLDIAKVVDPKVLDDAVIAMRDMGVACGFQAFFESDDEVRRDYSRMYHTIMEALAGGGYYAR